VLVKVAAYGLKPHMLGKSIAHLQAAFEKAVRPGRRREEGRGEGGRVCSMQPN